MILHAGFASHIFYDYIWGHPSPSYEPPLYFTLFQFKVNDFTATRYAGHALWLPVTGGTGLVYKQHFSTPTFLALVSRGSMFIG